jgi:AcrR family transcriptional regulator
MPRRVDHRERRAEVAAAARRVMARDGLENTTVRRVAEELGSSTTAVTHYFRSREDLVLAAIEDAYAAAAERMVAVATPDMHGLALARAILLEALPLDDARAAEVRVWLGFWAGAAFSPRLREVQRAGYGAWLDLLSGALREARRRGELRDGVDPRRAAEKLLLLIDGLSLQGTLEPDRITPRRQRALLDAELQGLRRAEP